MMKKAFTLLELLIVVAIIAILAAIAIPNFLEAQMRAKVARAKSDIRTAAMALDAYAVDHGSHPYPLFALTHDPSLGLNGFLGSVFELTTPVAYLTSVDLQDPFRPDWSCFSYSPSPPPGWQPTYSYDNYSGWFPNTLPSYMEAAPFAGYCVYSTGPDRKINNADFLPLFIGHPKLETPKRMGAFVHAIYDPTNGTASAGDIIRWTGKPQKYGSF